MRLFQNLIGNAIKYRNEHTNPYIQIDCQEQAEYWQVSIQDNGIGISPQYIQQIFSPFRRLTSKEEFSGTGIGLAICEKIIEQRGGRI